MVRAYLKTMWERRRQWRKDENCPLGIFPSEREEA
jgi:hypothetical protein